MNVHTTYFNLGLFYSSCIVNVRLPKEKNEFIAIYSSEKEHKKHIFHGANYMCIKKCFRVEFFSLQKKLNAI